jgi:hypothetical protein
MTVKRRKHPECYWEAVIFLELGRKSEQKANPGTLIAFHPATHAMLVANGAIV